MSKYFKCLTDKNPLTYCCDEKIVFTVFAKDNCVDTSCQYVYWSLKGDDGQAEEGIGSSKPGSPLVIEALLKKPGFVYLTCKSLNDTGNPDNVFDTLETSAGADVEKIKYLDTIPEDFDNYWSDIEKLVADFKYNVLMNEPVKIGVPDGFKAFEIRVSTPNGRPASGFVTIPKKDGKFPISISFNGYGISGSTPVYKQDYISVHFNAHGIENNLPQIELKKKYKTELLKNENGYSYGFDPAENASNMTCYWRNMMIRNLVGLKYVKSLPEWDGKNIIALGGSQAALQATTLAAHDKDITFLEIYIPWFCNLNAENKGYVASWRPRYAEGLRYFDTVAQATRVKCPVKIFAKLGDCICRASTVMALYNSFKVSKKLEFLSCGDHGYNPTERNSFYLWDYPESDMDFKPGKYKHFKGGEYELLYVGSSSEGYCEMQVIYKSLSSNKVWIRPAHMWNDLIFYDNKYVKRFEPIK